MVNFGDTTNVLMFGEYSVLKLCSSSREFPAPQIFELSIAFQIVCEAVGLREGRINALECTESYFAWGPNIPWPMHQCIQHPIPVLLSFAYLTHGPSLTAHVVRR